MKYIECGNASEAYRHAYDTSRVKKKTVWERASRLLSQDNVYARVEELREEARKKAQITHEKITEELAKIAFFDIRNIFDEDGTLKAPTALDDKSAGAVSAIKVRRIKGDGADIEDIIEMKISDKKAALEALGKHLGYFEKDNRQKAPVVINPFAKKNDDD